MERKKDDIFLGDFIGKFEFNDIVASVFDDMIERSVPFYNEIMRLAIYFILNYAQSNPKDLLIYDIGSSTGNTLIQLYDKLTQSALRAKLIGIDNSDSMIKLSNMKAKAMGYDIEFRREDILLSEFQACDVCASFYTMQFIRPPHRQELTNKIHAALKQGGIFLFAEKTISQDSKLESQMISCYHEYKSAQGYSKSEIYKKRQALENVLIPYSVDENMEMIKKAGFSCVEIIFKWVNFALFLARK